MKKWRLEDMAGDMEEDEVKEPPDEVTVMEVEDMIWSRSSLECNNFEIWNIWNLMS